MKTNVKLIRHRSPESVMAVYWKMPWRDLKRCSGKAMTPTAGKAKEIDFSPVQMRDSIRRMGFWGFALPKEKVIHCWIGKRTPKWRVAFLLGHELGHIAMKGSNKYFTKVRQFLKEEEVADVFGSVAATAFKWANR